MTDLRLTDQSTLFLFGYCGNAYMEYLRIMLVQLNSKNDLTGVGWGWDGEGKGTVIYSL